MTKLIDLRNWLDDGQQPTKRYYFELYSGQRGEADTPVTLFDLVCDPYYSDCDDRTTQIMMLGELLRDVAAQTLAFRRIRATVYSGVGPFYDNKISRFPDEVAEEGEMEFDNPESPVILDFWDEWTTIVSLVKCGYIRLFEKVPTFGTNHQNTDCAGCTYFQIEDNTCDAYQADLVFERMRGCAVWTRNETYPDYVEVKAEDLQEPLWKPNYVPIQERTEEYKGYRLRDE